MSNAAAVVRLCKTQAAFGSMLMVGGLHHPEWKNVAAIAGYQLKLGVKLVRLVGCDRALQFRTVISRREFERLIARAPLDPHDGA